MAAAGTLDAVGCLWHAFTAILPASSRSSSDTSRISATTDPPSLLLSARLNGSTRSRAAACSPRSPPFLLALAAATPAPWPLATSCPPLSPRSRVAAAASPFRSCPCVLRPSRCTVSGLSGDGGDDTTADDAEWGLRGWGRLHLGQVNPNPHKPRPPVPSHRLQWQRGCRRRRRAGLELRCVGHLSAVHGIACLALPSLTSSTRASHAAVPAVPWFARPTCAVLLACGAPVFGSTTSPTPQSPAAPSQSADRPLRTKLTVSCLFSYSVSCSNLSACAPPSLLAAPSPCLASAAPGS